MSVKYSFSFVYGVGEEVSMHYTTTEGVPYKEVSDNFFKFLSAAYGYEITAKDVIDEDFSYPGLSD